MAAIGPVDPRAEANDTGVLGRGAAADMAAIFGPGARSGEAVPTVDAVRGERRRWPKPLTIVAAVALLGGSVVAGLLVGDDLRAVSATAPLAQGGRAAPHPRATAAPVTAFVLDTPTSPVPTPSATPEADVRAPVKTTALADPPTPAPSRAPDVAAVRPPSAATDAEVPRPDPTARCEDDDACVADRVDAAEQRLDAAFRQAAAAGVRPGTLRGYQREWDRAHDAAADRPFEAIRLYAMMASDLRNLAEDEADRR